MLTLERRFQNEEEIWTRRVARIAAGLPLELPKPDEEEEEQQPVPMEVADSEEDEAEQPVPMEVADLEEDKAKQPEELVPAVGFSMEDKEAEFAVAQVAEMAKQQAILESIQDATYVEAH